MLVTIIIPQDGFLSHSMVQTYFSWSPELSVSAVAALVAKQSSPPLAFVQGLFSVSSSLLVWELKQISKKFRKRRMVLIYLAWNFIFKQEIRISKILNWKK